jgi:hypothetical protein
MSPYVETTTPQPLGQGHAHQTKPDQADRLCGGPVRTTGNHLRI